MRSSMSLRMNRQPPRHVVLQRDRGAHVGRDRTKPVHQVRRLVGVQPERLRLLDQLRAGGVVLLLHLLLGPPGQQPGVDLLTQQRDAGRDLVLQGTAGVGGGRDLPVEVLELDPGGVHADADLRHGGRDEVLVMGRRIDPSLDGLLRQRSGFEATAVEMHREVFADLAPGIAG